MTIIVNNDDETDYTYTFILEHGKIYFDDLHGVGILEMNYDWNKKHFHCDNLTRAINRYAEECERVVNLRYN